MAGGQGDMKEACHRLRDVVVANGEVRGRQVRDRVAARVADDDVDGDGAHAAAEGRRLRALYADDDRVSRRAVGRQVGRYNRGLPPCAASPQSPLCFEDAMRRLGSLPLTLCLLCLAAPAAAQTTSPVCKPVIDSMTRVITMDHATSSDIGGKTTKTITAGGVNYVQVSGSWRKSTLGPQDALQQVKDNLRNATAYRCTQLADDAVAGEAAAVYTVHEENPQTKADSKLWISKKTGLPLKSDEDLAGVGHIATVYSYTDIKAPVVR
jgi:hypothetical protein